MRRSKKLVLVAHCMLNQNSVAPGLARYGGAVEPLIRLLVDGGYGIYQLPCPETSHIGLKRFWMTRSQYDNVGFRKHCRRLATLVADDVAEYSGNGIEVRAVIGVAGSPSCGAEWTSEGAWRGDPRKAGEDARVRGMGIFMEELFRELRSRGVEAVFVDYDYRDEEGSLRRIASLLEV